MSATEKLAQALKVKFGTSPSEPSPTQMVRITAEVAKVQASGQAPTDDDWRRAVHNACPDAGRYKYAGLDNSDLNTLLALATKSAGD
jgi:hypothetical protein